MHFFSFFYLQTLIHAGKSVPMDIFILETCFGCYFLWNSLQSNILCLNKFLGEAAPLTLPYFLSGQKVWI